MTKFFKPLVLTALLLSACSSGEKKQDSSTTKNQSSPQVALTPSMIVGIWKSPTSEFAGNGQYSVREYNISLNHWELIYTLAGDKEMKKPIYIYHAVGTFSLDGISKVTGATNIIFNFNTKALNLKSKEKLAIDDLSFGPCKLTRGKEKDVSVDGCSFIRPLKECKQEFDIIKIENGTLRLGERPADNDLCKTENRPEALGPELKKVN